MLHTFNATISLKKITESGQCFRWNQVSDNRYQIVAFNRILEAIQLDSRTIGLDCTQDEFHEIWSHYFDIRTDYSQLDFLKTDNDLFIRDAYKYGEGIRILHQDPWEVLITFLISQQKNIPAIKSTINKMSQIYGIKLAQNIYSFPTPEMFLDKGLDGLKLCSLGYREKYIRDAIQKLNSNPTLLKDLGENSDKTLYQNLQAFYGVGPKVANCIRLFGYNRLNSFPEDVWIKRALKNYYPDGFPFDKYSPYNGIIQQYIFYYYRNFSE